MALPTLLDLAGWVPAALVGCELKQHTSIPPALEQVVSGLLIFSNAGTLKNIKEQKCSRKKTTQDVQIEMI